MSHQITTVSDNIEAIPLTKKNVPLNASENIVAIRAIRFICILSVVRDCSS